MKGAASDNRQRISSRGHRNLTTMPAAILTRGEGGIKENGPRAHPVTHKLRKGVASTKPQKNEFIARLAEMAFRRLGLPLRGETAGSAPVRPKIIQDEAKKARGRARSQLFGAR